MEAMDLHQDNLEMLHSLLWVWFGNCKPMRKIKPSRLRDLWSETWFAKGEKQALVDNKLQRFRLLLDFKWTTHSGYGWQELGLLVLYDQLPRNIFRGDPRAYAYDAAALQLAKRLLLKEESLPLHGKLAVIICFMHSENIADHEAIQAFAATTLTNQHLDPCVRSALKQMIACHCKRIALFGRIPERNMILNRVSSLAEVLYLQEVRHTVSL